MNKKPNFDDFFEIINSDEFQAFQEEYRHVNSHQNNWGYKNKEKLRKHQKNYEKFEKGINSIRKKQKIRRQRMISAQADLNYEEKILIRKFYDNCPEGYEVDHIVPISRGGKHCLSNLQYLTPEENRKKAYRLYYKANINSKFLKKIVD